MEVRSCPEFERCFDLPWVEFYSRPGVGTQSQTKPDAKLVEPPIYCLVRYTMIRRHHAQRNPNGADPLTQKELFLHDRSEIRDACA